MFGAMPLVVTWLGQAGFRFEVGERRILVDPFFAEHEDRTYPPPSLDEFGAGIDWLLVTHEHIDHLDPFSLREVAARSDDLTIVAPAPLEPLVREAAPDTRFTGVDRGDRVELPGAGVCTVVPAIHGPTVAHGYPDDPAFVGYVFELAGTSLYHAGDTIVTDELTAALKPLHVGVALLPINGRDPERESRGIVGNMDASEAAELALDLGASRLVPYHWDGFRGNTVPPGTVVDAAAGRLHVVVPARFETFEL